MNLVLVRICLGLAVVTLLALPSARAAADTPATYAYEFTDVSLVAKYDVSTSRTVRLLRIPRCPPQGPLIRTRASFVQELVDDIGL